MSFTWKYYIFAFIPWAVLNSDLILFCYGWGQFLTLVYHFFVNLFIVYTGFRLYRYIRLGE